MEHIDELGGFQLLEIRSSLPDELLMYADKLSMAHSLEGRVPYLDRTVVEYVQRLDATLKIRHGTRKWLHRQVCQSYLPPHIVKRKKRGFAVNVVDGWFRSSVQGQLSELLLDESSLMYELLKREPVRELLSEHRRGRQDNHKLLFSLVMVEQWLRGRLPDEAPNYSPHFRRSDTDDVRPFVKFHEKRSAITWTKSAESPSTSCLAAGVY
jgi:asparagine synthase (glutamine-hydrolysing)